MAQVNVNGLADRNYLSLPTLGQIPLDGALVTPSNAATALFSWVPPADGTYLLLTAATAKKVSDGASSGFLTMTVVKSILGVLTIVGDVAIHAAVADGGFAPSVAYAVNGTALEFRATGVAATPVAWQANAGVTVS